MRTITRSAALLFLSLCLLSCASTPAILGPDGKPLPGSVSSLEAVRLNGRKEWISLRGRDASKPLLLFLSGGPGGSELATVRRTLGALEERFVVAVWDQPGAGKSFAAIDHDELSLEVYLQDAEALVDLLCGRFKRDKLFVLGESWGSFLGVLLAQRRPDRIEAFFGTGQMVAFKENDRACYDLALDWCRQKGDGKKLAKLVKQGPPPYYGRKSAARLSAVLLETFDYMREALGVRGSGDTIGDILSPEYNLLDKANWIRGLLASLESFYPKLQELDLRAIAPRLEVPSYFLLGRLDVNASLPLFLDYYGRLQAPDKEVVWFERSGHTPWSSETGLFVAELFRLSGVGEEGATAHLDNK